MPNRKSSDTPPSALDIAPLKPGVWRDPAAADGYVGLVVVNNSGERPLKIEIASDKFSPDWIPLLEHWLEHGDVAGMHIVR